MEDISKQSGRGNSPPNPADGKLMYIRLSKIVTAMSRFTASGLDKKEHYSYLYSKAKPEVRLYSYSIHVVGCNNIQCNFTSQHNCDVVKYVNFYVVFVASN